MIASAGHPRESLTIGAPAGSAPSVPVHALRVGEVHAALSSRPGGLPQADIEERLRRHGPNTIREVRGAPLSVKFLSQFTHRMALLLWAGGLIGFLAGMPQLGVAVWAVNVVNGCFSFWQEYKAEKATEALRRLLPAYARVVRGGEERRVEATALVPGDVLLLHTGDKVAADGRLLEAINLEVDEATLNLDPAKIAPLVTPRTRALLAVHLYGNPANVTALLSFTRQRRLNLIEDCAQAHGALHAGRRVGTFGAAAAWSFYPTKNVGAFGDGGMVTTNEAAVCEQLRLLREYGWRERYHSAEHGWNSRLDELQAALLRVRLRHLEADNARRREIARTYRAALSPRISGPLALATVTDGFGLRAGVATVVVFFVIGGLILLSVDEAAGIAQAGLPEPAL